MANSILGLVTDHGLGYAEARAIEHICAKEYSEAIWCLTQLLPEEDSPPEPAPEVKYAQRWRSRDEDRYRAYQVADGEFLHCCHHPNGHVFVVGVVDGESTTILAAEECRTDTEALTSLGYEVRS